jgi:uncharacterized protein YciW
VECHGEESYRKKFQEWRDSIKVLTENLRAALRAARKTALTDDQKSQLTATETALTAIEEDGSLGIHNHAFIEDFLTKALKKIKSLGTPSINE